MCVCVCVCDFKCRYGIYNSISNVKYIYISIISFEKSSVENGYH